MVKQFLKIAGVKTQSEFYKKYPTEAAFFRAHPEAKQLVRQQMAYGGMYAYEPGGPTGQDLNNIGGPSMPVINPDMQGMLWGTPPSLGMAPAQPPMAMPPAPLKNYEGVSVWDLLSAQGKAGDFATRKELAKTLGIGQYTGTKDQNKLMMDLIKQNPQVLEGITAGSAAAPRRRASKPVAAPQDDIQLTDADYAAYNDAQAAANPYVMAPGAPPPPATPPFGYFPSPGRGTSPKTKQGMSTSAKVALGTGIALGTGVAAGAFSEIKDLMKRAGKGEYLNGQAKAKVTAYRNQFRNQMLKEAGSNIKNQQKWFSKLPSEQQNILKNLDAMEISGDIHTMPHGTASRDLYTRDMLNEANAEGMLTNTNDALREAEEEAKVLRSANAKKAAAARWGSKAEKVAKAEEVLGLGSRISKGLQAFGKMKYVEPIFDFGKGLIEKEEGGEQTPYSDTYSNGVYYANGGAFIPDYGMMAAGQLPEYGYGKAMYGMGMAEGGPTYSDMTQYNHQGYVPAFDWMQDGGSPLYSTQGQTLRNYNNTAAAGSGWYGRTAVLPNVGPNNRGNGSRTLAGLPNLGHGLTIPRNFEDGGQQMQDMYARGGQKSSGAKDQQILQGVAQMLQQGVKPEEVLQELVQAKIPQKKAVAIIQNVMQQMGGAAQQQAAPAQQMMDESQMASYGGSYAKGGEYDMSEDEIQDLINKGYKIEYV